MSLKNWEQFYLENPPPNDQVEVSNKIKRFVQIHKDNGTRVALVTSGGTTVPLEHNTVRFVDNFSAGTRGSTSAEYFLKQDYAVIFLHRYKSLEPFSRRFPATTLLDMLEIDSDNQKNSIKIIPSKVSEVLPVLKAYHAFKEEKLLMVPFTTLPEYLHLLRNTSEILSTIDKQALLYLAAAVSDFYVPSSQMVTHKIQSVNGPLHLQLELVPKVLQPLVVNWVPNAFVVSFKLETDESLLIPKSKAALERYGHSVVVANELHSRKYKVVIVEKTSEMDIVLSEDELKAGVEIEEKIVNFLTAYHSKHINN